MMPRHRAVVFVAGIAVFVLALAYLVYGGIQQGASYWVTVSELRHRPAGAPARARLGGTVVPGSVIWDASHEHLRFAVTDGENSIPVRSTLLAKCPTKYNPADPPSPG